LPAKETGAAAPPRWGGPQDRRLRQEVSMSPIRAGTPDASFLWGLGPWFVVRCLEHDCVLDLVLGCSGSGRRFASDIVDA